MSKPIEPYEGPAGGWDALASVARTLRAQGQPVTAARALLRANQPEGFDCPGCAWPDPKHTSSFEFCENGAKAVAWEATGRAVGPEFFAQHTVDALRAQSDHWLEAQGRLVHPLRYDARTDRYEPIDWAEAFERIGRTLRALPSAHQAAFYTSGRTSNEAAFLYQLFVRLYGTNNLPDCSNLCHEATSIGLPESIGVGKGTVRLEDFEHADAVLSFGHNPGSNHPRMLSTLRAVARRRAPIVVFNPLRERGLERFRSPQHAAELLGAGETELATHYFQPRVGTDHRVLQGMMKRLLELDAAEPTGGWIDRAFLAQHTIGLDALAAELQSLRWDALCEETGLTRECFETATRLYARARSVIVAYGMGITQHRHGARNVQQIANLLLLRGNIGRPGAGICPVRGHSNVQGDRTMGINERPPEAFLARLDAVFGFAAPRAPGVTVIECIEAMRRGEIRALVSLGGNFAVASPDPKVTHAAMRGLDLYVGIHTKLNRSHLLPGREALILPCLGRTEVDLQASGPQAVTVEDSMSMVHASRGMKAPASPRLKSEPAIVAAMAAATLRGSQVPWSWLVEDYDRIRDLIEQTIPGFERFNERIRVPGGFHLANPAAMREWRTASGRARLVPFGPADAPASEPLPLRLTTIRSHDQYNTTIYGYDDRYRGVRGRRDVLFMNEDDMRARGLVTGATICVTAGGEPDGPRRLDGWIAVAYPVARGCCAAYYPEAMPLVALSAYDPASRTPAYKSIAVDVQPLHP